jgi:hypothetical protein
VSQSSESDECVNFVNNVKYDARMTSFVFFMWIKNNEKWHLDSFVLELCKCWFFLQFQRIKTKYLNIALGECMLRILMMNAEIKNKMRLYCFG